MKLILISILAIASLTCCTKGDKNGGLGPDDSAPIVLNAGVPTATARSESKAPIVSNSTFTAMVAGWEASGTVDYTQSASWNTTTSTITASAVAQAITLTTAQVYNTNSAIKTHIKAWYPAEAPTLNVVSFTNTDGSVDAMLSTSIVGSKSDRRDKTLAFVHKTTQLKFIVKKGEGLAAGTTIDKITVKDAELPTGFDLTKEATATDAVSYAAIADLDVADITPGAITIGTTPTGDAAGSPLMIKPITGNTVMLDITTNNNTYTGIKATIDNDPDFVEGRAYTITLIFGQSSVDLKTTVADWTTETGSGNVQ